MSLPVDGNLDLQSVNKIVNVPTPTAAGDAVPKSYADSLAAGLSFIPAVVAASIGANVPLNAPGATLDGVTLTNPSRVLLKDQTTASQNGVWVWTGAAVTMTRPTGAADYKTGAIMQPGTSVFVEGGTQWADAQFTLLGSANVTVDTSASTWSQTNALADIAVTAPITKTGNTIGITSPLPVANGGTGSATAAGARTALGTVGKYATTVGDAATTTFTVTHNLGTTDVQVSVLDMATGNMELVQWTVTGTNTITVGAFGTAPGTASGTVGSGVGKRVIVTG